MIKHSEGFYIGLAIVLALVLNVTVREVCLDLMRATYRNLVRPRRNDAAVRPNAYWSQARLLRRYSSGFL